MLRLSQGDVRKARRALRAHTHLSARVTLALHDADGNPATEHLRLRLTR